jgi:hypothetical protein
MDKHQRAAQIWALLVMAARNQPLLSYNDIESMTGVARHGVGTFLGPIQTYCERNGLPPLTSLVIKEETGMPGTGFTGAAGRVEGSSPLLRFDWTAKKAPKVRDFAAIK